MRSKTSASHEIASHAIGVFMNDGTIDMRELDFLLSLALKDNEVDEDEKRVLGNIFSRIPRAEVTPEIWQRIQAIKQEYGIK